MKMDKIYGNAEDQKIVNWEEKYATGIEPIDAQHMKLFELANHLFAACSAKDDVLQKTFKEAMHSMVDYVHFHFSAELKLLHAVDYPDYHNHKKHHDDLIKEILTAVKDYDEGKKFVPNHFVRTLRDWILSHIAVCDKAYSYYIRDLIHNDTLSENKFREILSAACS